MLKYNVAVKRGQAVCTSSGFREELQQAQYYIAEWNKMIFQHSSYLKGAEG